jgi:hypothetical protein
MPKGGTHPDQSSIEGNDDLGVRAEGRAMNIRHSVIVIFGIFLFNSCKGAGMEILQAGYSRLDEISQARWDVLSQKKIFFGHQSVGVNIIEGLKEVIARRPGINLNIRETFDSVDFSEPVFAHSPIGKNNLPVSKIERFREIMESGVGQAADIVFLKFCFVDIDHATDIESLFKGYVELIDDLEKRFPNLKIVTFTVPLQSKPVGIKTRLKKILGRLPWYEADNVKRNLYNDMLRARFKESLFDLAAVESRIDDTKKATFRENGKEYELLYRAYTDDGGHLNSTGRQVVAIELLRTLANLRE